MVASLIIIFVAFLLRVVYFLRASMRHVSDVQAIEVLWSPGASFVRPRNECEPLKGHYGRGIPTRPSTEEEAGRADEAHAVIVP